MTKLVHRLVAEAFIPNPNNYTDVDHIDGDRTNNNVSNLRWCTRSMNMLNPITRQRVADVRRQPTKKNRRAIAQLKGGLLVAKYESASEAHRLHGFHIGGIYECIRRPTRTLQGYHWRWLDEWESSNQ